MVRHDAELTQEEMDLLIIDREGDIAVLEVIVGNAQAFA
jgi:hypothetical protein